MPTQTVNLTLQQDITRVALQALISGSTVIPKRTYRITDAIGPTAEIILVKGLTINSITGYAINETTNEWGTYDIGTDVFEKQNMTLQEVLLAGATMSQNNTVAGAGFRFLWDNFLRFTVITTERVSLTADNGTDDGSVTINPAQIVYSTTNATTSSQLEQSPTGFTFDKPLNQHLGTALASAATVNIGAATGDTVHITGTTTITAFDAIGHGAIRHLIFDGSLTLTNNANIILLSGANIQTAAGDTSGFVSEGAGVWRQLYYQRANGKPVVQSGYITSPVKLNSSITPHTGTTTETVVFTDDVPVGTLIANDQLFFFVGCGATSNANNKTFRVYFNDTPDLLGTPVLVATFIITSNAIQSGFGRYLVSKASISSWQTHSATSNISNPYSSTGSAASTVTIDFSTLKYFVLTCQLANSADTMNVIAVNTQVLR